MPAPGGRAQPEEPLPPPPPQPWHRPGREEPGRRAGGDAEEERGPPLTGPAVARQGRAWLGRFRARQTNPSAGGAAAPHLAQVCPPLGARMERVGAASGAERAGPELPMEPLGSREPGPEPEPGPAEEARRPDSPPRSPGPAGDERRRPARPRSLGMGYGAFHHPGGPEPPSPVAEPPRDGDTPGPEPGAWAPMDLQWTSGPDGKKAAALLPHAKGTRLPRAIELMGKRAPARPPARNRDPDLRPHSSWYGAGTRRPSPRLLVSGLGPGRVPTPSSPGLPMYMKSLRWALAIMAFLLAVSTVTMVALAARAGAGCRRCPQGWMWVEEQCFYLSADAQAWEASQAFCSAHHATLPLLSHTQGFLSNHHVAPRSWVGALRGPQGWYWTDGTPLPLQLLPEDDDHPELSCGGLEEGRLVALDCTAPRPWICARAPQ
nr:killer cell lectin-like receptor subfamily G member 2 [Loxodonta africana]